MTGVGSQAARGKLLFCSVNLNPPGGGQCVGAWALQALQQDWDITILCSQRPDFAALNRHFGTRLDHRDFHFVQLPWLLRNINRVDPDPNSFQAAAWLMRKARKLASEFDVSIAVDNEMDMGRPGIQYVHYPYLASHRPRVDTIERSSPLQRLGAFLRWEYRPWMLISGISFSRITSNLTLVNSHWSANLVRGLYEIQPSVVYPPVLWSAPQLNWEQRRDTFVSLGRIEPGKRQIEAIGIIERVRQRGHEVQLEIIGDISDPKYARRLRERAAAAGPWVRLQHGIPRGELEQLVGQCRYGLHTMLDEHFGIAVAELVRAGCVVFVPAGGGQVEIIGHEPALKYAADDQAVEQICRVLENHSLQSALRTRLAELGESFTEQAFMQQLRDQVQRWVVENHSQRAS